MVYLNLSKVELQSISKVILNIQIYDLNFFILTTMKKYIIDKFLKKL